MTIGWTSAYKQLMQKVKKGQAAKERNGSVVCRSVEHVCHTLDLSKVGDPFVFIPDRKWGLKIALAEVDWIIGHEFKLQDSKILEFAPALSKFKNTDDEHFHAQYGTRIYDSGRQRGINPTVDQIKYCVDQVKAEDGILQNSRRMVVTLWDPELDTQTGKLDYPCNIAMMFSISTENEVSRINLSVVRRSNDIIWGIQNNWVQFWSIYQDFVIRLKHKFPDFVISAGMYTEFINNLHFYVEHPYGESYDNAVKAAYNFNFMLDENQRFYSEDNVFLFSTKYVEFRQKVLSLLHQNDKNLLKDYVLKLDQPRTNLENYLRNFLKMEIKE